MSDAMVITRKYGPVCNVDQECNNSLMMSKEDLVSIVLHVATEHASI